MRPSRVRRGPLRTPGLVELLVQQTRGLERREACASLLSGLGRGGGALIVASDLLIVAVRLLAT
jgi:hypothetical protein